MAGVVRRVLMSLSLLSSPTLECLLAVDLDLALEFAWWYFYLRTDALLPRA